MLLHGDVGRLEVKDSTEGSDYSVVFRDGVLYRILSNLLGSFRKITSPSGDYSIGATDSLINYTSGTFTTTLPTAVGVEGRLYDIKNSGIGIITVDTVLSQTIDVDTSIDLIQYESITLISNGTNWIVI